MEQKQLLEFLRVAGRLKDTPRHSWTAEGRHESVAEHSWRLSLFALLVSDEFKELDMNKVIRMCIIHDLGEAVTGDIPSFNKTKADEDKENAAITGLVGMLSEPLKQEFSYLYAEMDSLSTEESKLYKALDNLEAVITHNEAPISSWIEKEYSENLTYGEDKCAFSSYLVRLREIIKDRTKEKIENS